jgi:hypothetical protein
MHTYMLLIFKTLALWEKKHAYGRVANRRIQVVSYSHLKVLSSTIQSSFEPLWGPSVHYSCAWQVQLTGPPPAQPIDLTKVIRSAGS